jgi:hypothetical protein
MSFEKGIK